MKIANEIDEKKPIMNTLKASLTNVIFRPSRLPI